jgi:hypothetical protein
MIEKVSNSALSLLLLLPLLTLVPNPSFSQVTSDGLPFESGFNESDISTGLSDVEQQEQEEQKERALQQQQQNWSTYEDPIAGIQFEHPSWWEKTEKENLIKFYPLPHYTTIRESGNFEVFVNVHSFLPPLEEEMNTLDKFMRLIMNELRSDDTQNVSVNRTSTIGVDDIPAYKVESESVIEDILHTKSIRYFSIDNSTGTGYLISLTTEMDRLQEDVPLFERMVESFKILA